MAMTQREDGEPTEPTSRDTPEQAEFRDEVRAFLVANATPRGEASPWAVTMHRSQDTARRAFEAGRAWQRTLSEHRLAGLTYPVELGGRGGSAWHERVYNEEARGYDASSGFVSATIAMLGPTLMQHASDAQKAEYVPRLLSGEYAFCQLFSEPGAGSDLAGLACRAVRDGDEFVVTGQKVWNSAAQFCNWGMLLVRTNPDVPKHRGITFLLVDMATPGIEARPLVQATGASEFNEVFLNDVRVPVANAIGEVDGGWVPARTVLSNESAFIGGGSTAAGSRFERLLSLADRHGSRGDADIRQRLADSFIRERIVGVMGERIMAAVRQRQAPPVDPAALKLFTTESRVRSGNLAMAIRGPAGPTGDDEVAIWTQMELLGRYSISIGGGTDEVQKNNLAERALGLPREPRTDHEMPWKDVPRS
ncbi:MAG: acyl-CoA dehydrogenase family protein [Actinomycetota bacterium]